MLSPKVSLSKLSVATPADGRLTLKKHGRADIDAYQDDIKG
jgi:hypothetical protein